MRMNKKWFRVYFEYKWKKMWEVKFAVPPQILIGESLKSTTSSFAADFALSPTSALRIPLSIYKCCACSRKTLFFISSNLLMLLSSNMCMYKDFFFFTPNIQRNYAEEALFCFFHPFFSSLFSFSSAGLISHRTFPTFHSLLHLHCAHLHLHSTRQWWKMNEQQQRSTEKERREKENVWNEIMNCIKRKWIFLYKYFYFITWYTWERSCVVHSHCWRCWLWSAAHCWLKKSSI